jgi:DUF438 domain-containing protein
MEKYEPDEKLIAILQEISEKDNLSSMKDKYGQYLYSITPMDLAIAEQELVNRGVELKVLETRLEQHIKLLINPVRELFESLPSTHVLKKLIAEHRHLDYLLGEIQQLSSQLHQISYLTATSSEFKELIHIASYVHISSKHTDIEEQIIFPMLEEIGIEVIPRILRAQHFEVRHHSVQFHELAFHSAVTEPTKTAHIYNEIASTLISLKKKHIFIEEHLIYPIALDIIGNQIWDKLKGKCESVGFC